MWYKILGVNEDASWEEIEKAYITLMRDPKVSLDDVTSNSLKNAYKEAQTHFKEVNQQTNDISNNKNRKLKKFCRNTPFIILSLTILSFFISAMRGDNSYITSIVPKYTLNMQQCLTANKDKGVLSNEEAKRILIENGYDDIFVEDMHVSANKSIGNRKIQFDLYTIDFYSRCEMEIYEEIIDENEYFSRSILYDGYNYEIFDVDYIYKNIDKSDDVYSDIIAIDDTIDTYKMSEYAYYSGDIYNRYFDESKDLELRDALLDEMKNLK